MGGAFSWEEMARYRDRWKGPLVLKGILHPADAEKAVALGADGILVARIKNLASRAEQVAGLNEAPPLLAAVTRGRSRTP